MAGACFVACVCAALQEADHARLLLCLPRDPPAHDPGRARWHRDGLGHEWLTACLSNKSGVQRPFQALRPARRCWRYCRDVQPVAAAAQAGASSVWAGSVDRWMNTFREHSNTNYGFILTRRPVRPILHLSRYYNIIQFSGDSTAETDRGGLGRARLSACTWHEGVFSCCRRHRKLSPIPSRSRKLLPLLFSEWLRQARHAHAARTYENCGLCCCEVAWIDPHLTT